MLRSNTYFSCRIFSLTRCLQNLAVISLCVYLIPSVSHAFKSASGVDGTVNEIAVQANGKVLICGRFNEVNGISRNGIARLNADGSVDQTFAPSIGTNGSVSALVVRADGKVMIWGSFTEVNGISRSGIARLNSDGSLDQTFSPGDGTDGTVNALAVQADGKVVIGGFFSEVNGISRNNIARLNADGSVDQMFATGSGVNGNILTLALQADGKVLIGGVFTQVEGNRRNRIARLNADDGSVDRTFATGSGVNGNVGAIAVQADGKMVIGGNFSVVRGNSRNNIARLDVDSSVDQMFDPGSGANSDIFEIVVQTDGKVLIGGRFTEVNGISRRRIARLNPDGGLDQTFAPENGANNGVSALAVQADGKVLIGGRFTEVNGISRSRIARLNADGSLDDGSELCAAIHGANGKVAVICL